MDELKKQQGVVNRVNSFAFLRKSSLNLFSKVKKVWAITGLEASFWIFGLFFLVFINSPETPHLTICPVSNLGFEFCPGCGLGNSISYLFRGNFEASIQSHPLGIVAFLTISYRIISLIKNNRRRLCQMSYN
jgi:hypothetical protein